MVFGVLLWMAFASGTAVYGQMINEDTREDFVGNYARVRFYSGYPDSITPSGYLGVIVTTVFGFLGVAAFIVVLYGGILWATAGGNEERLTAAKTMLRNGAIGLGIVFIAYAVAILVISLLGSATGFGTPFDTGSPDD